MANTAKENILKRVRAALQHTTPLPFPNSEGSSSIFKDKPEELEVMFAQEFVKLQGNFSYCENMEQLKLQLTQLITARKWDKVFCVEEFFKEKFNTTIDLALCDASITSCEYLVARTGSIVLSGALQSGRTVSVYAPVHICIAYTSQLVFDIRDALVAIKEKYKGTVPSFITFASGPSRTADIEKTLVTGVHGPKEVFCFLIEG